MKIDRIIIAAFAVLAINACSDDEEPFIAPPVESAIIDAQVGGETQPNQVYIDLSSEVTKAVPRNSYDLSFYSGDQFRVVLNNSTSSLALALDANDLNDISAADTTGLAAQLDVNAIFGALFGPPPSWLADAATWMDDPSGDITKTAIAEVSATAEENNVYILNRGNNPDGSNIGWKKIRVIRSGNGYQLQHADIGATSFETLDIPKNSNLQFVQMNFESGIVEATPSASQWDLAFTTYTNLLAVGPGTNIPYSFKDFVITNAAQVQVSSVSTDNISYEDFTSNDLAALTFSNDINGIGSTWRSVAQPNSEQQTGVVEDIFYVIKDATGNTYKVKFTRMLNPQTGERGYPQLQYDLISE